MTIEGMKRWNSMSIEERRKLMPKRLNKLGEWMLRQNYDWNIDKTTPAYKSMMRAVLK